MHLQNTCYIHYNDAVSNTRCGGCCSPAPMAILLGHHNIYMWCVCSLLNDYITLYICIHTCRYLSRPSISG